MTNDGNRSIIEAGSEKSMDYIKNAAYYFEIKRPGYHVVKYNPKADYSINLSNLSDFVNKGLSDACRNVAEEGSMIQREVLILADLNNGTHVYREVGNYGTVGGRDFWKFLAAHAEGKFAFVHNHPNDGFLSAADMQTFAGNKQIQLMISTSNDGLKRIAYGNIKQSSVVFYHLYKNDIEILRNKIRSGKLDDVEYVFELEKLIVSNAIKDFANLGFWEVDGRV